MRIDTSNLLVAAQVQTRPAAAVKTPQTAAFEPPALDAKTSANNGKPAANPGLKRLGQQLDIKI